MTATLPQELPLELEELVLEDEGPGRSGAELDVGELRTALIAALRRVFDPEIPVNVYDLGLVYRLDVDQAGRVAADLTLTAPGCPVADLVLRQAHAELLSVPGVSRVRTRLVWDPPWDPTRLSDAVRLQLGLD
jgi:FeS assembly SUF system protein